MNDKYDYSDSVIIYYIRWYDAVHSVPTFISIILTSHDFWILYRVLTFYSNYVSYTIYTSISEVQLWNSKFNNALNTILCVVDRHSYIIYC